MNILKGVLNKKIIKEEFNAEVDDEDEEEYIAPPTGSSLVFSYRGTKITSQQMADLINKKQVLTEEYNRDYDILTAQGVDPAEIPMDLSSSGSFNPYHYPGMYSTSYINDIKSPSWSGDISDELVDKIWKKMYEQPVLVRCPHCESANVVTNPTCIQCGAPLGKAKKVQHG